MITASPIFWNKKKVLLTGHTGFKGAWLAFWLSRMGAKVTGVALPPNADPNLFTLASISRITDSHFADIRDADAVSKIVKKAQPEIVFHLAAQALVRSGYKDPLTTFGSNIMGTANILNGIRDVESVRAVVAVTTDKVYKNLETGKAYKEDDRLGGCDPYSASKAACELVIDAYRDSYLSNQGVTIASARAGNVIGGGDWSDDRLIPDAIRSWNMDVPLKIRRPKAVRPWQHVLEPINGYLVLAEKIYTNSLFAGAYNFGPKENESASVQWVIKLANQAYGCGSTVWGDEMEGPHEAGLLSLEVSKAQKMLGVEPRWSLEESIIRTIQWYQGQKNGVNVNSLCESDIQAFINSQVG